MQRFFPLRLFQQLVLYWFSKNGRTLPWREKLVSVLDYKDHTEPIRNPYAIFIAEMMLQQTQVVSVIPKFISFIEKWPSIETLANAKLSDVIIAWKGLGYNRRARYLLETAKIISTKYGGKFPTDTKSLLDLPGFGPYMVSAIQVFAYDAKTAVIDVNVSRIYSRVQVGTKTIPSKEIRELALLSIPDGKSDAWHQGLMDFGATICTAKSPQCSHCFLARICCANLEAQANGFSSFQAWIKTHPKRKNSSKKDIGKRFEETDRYFRGRIVDFLREGNQPMEKLQLYMLESHKLLDLKRFAILIENLVTDGLIQVRGNTVQLAIR